MGGEDHFRPERGGLPETPLGICLEFSHFFMDSLPEKRLARIFH
jgi:hypothetical protein